MALIQSHPMKDGCYKPNEKCLIVATINPISCSHPVHHGTFFNVLIDKFCDRIPSTTPGAEPPRDARDSGSARSHSTHLETSSSDRP